MTTSELQKEFDHISKYNRAPKYFIRYRSVGEKNWQNYTIIPEGWNNCVGIIPSFASHKECESYIYDLIKRMYDIKDGRIQPTSRENSQGECEFHVEETLDFIRKMSDDPDKKYSNVY